MDSTFQIRTSVKSLFKVISKLNFSHVCPLPWSLCYCVCYSCCGSAGAPARCQVSQTEPDSQDTGTGPVPTPEPPTLLPQSPKPHTALGNSHIRS